MLVLNDLKSRPVEFYFADANLPYDKQVYIIAFLILTNMTKNFNRFMWTLHMKDPDHWVPISTVGSFKRMREYNANGTEWLADAIKLSDFLEVDDTGTKVRRTTEPQEPKNQLQRSVYAVCVLFFFLIIVV